MRWIRAPAGVALLLAALGAAAAPAAGQTAPGYVLNPPGGDTTRERDDHGMSYLRETRRRTPTGFLYPEPLEPQTLQPLADDWLGRGSLEIGGMTDFGDTQETRFSRYADWKREFLLDSFDLGVLHAPSGFHLDARGGAVGRSDAYYSGEVGWLSTLRLRGTWSGVPRDYANDARNLFQGAGSETLRLPAPLVPGSNSDASVAAALAGIERSRISVQRDALGLHLDARPMPGLRLFAGYDRQARDGDRPFGGSLVYATGFTQFLARSVETTQPLDDTTHGVFAGLELEREEIVGRLAYRGSFYRNEDEALTWDNPFQISPLGRGSANVRLGRFALAPDNGWNNVKGDFSARLPLDGVFTATLSWSHLHQNDDLIPFTANSGTVGAGANALNLDDWNTEDALTRSGADATAETLLANADLRLRPWRLLRLGARLRYYDRDDQTQYTAENARTRQIGYVAEDGALNVGTPLFSRVFRPGQQSDDWRYRSTPYDYGQVLAEGTADCALRPKTSLGLRYRWQRLGYANRERDHTDEDRVRVELASREISFATARLSWEWGDRAGDSYDPDPYRRFYVSSLPGFVPFSSPLPPFTLPELRKPDLANRRQQVADLRLNFLVREDMDLALIGRWQTDDYGALYGLRQDQRADATLEWSFQPSPRWGASLFGSYENGRRRIKTVNDAGATFPPQDTWWETTRDETVIGGASGWVKLFERVTLETSYSFLLARSRLDYDYASDGALSLGVTGATAGSRFPTLATEDHVLATSLRFELQEHVALRVFHRWQRSRLDDFQQAGLRAGVIAGAYYLGHEDRGYGAHVVGSTLQVRF